MTLVEDGMCCIIGRLKDDSSLGSTFTILSRTALTTDVPVISRNGYFPLIPIIILC
jgi:hypothetical protein